MQLVLFCLFVPFLGTAGLLAIIWLLELVGLVAVPPDTKVFIGIVLFVGWSFVAFDLWRRYRG